MHVIYDTVPTPVARRADDGIWLNLASGAQVLVQGDPPTADGVGVVLPLDEHWRVRVTTAERLWEALRDQPPPPQLTRQRRARLAHSLRAIDGRRAGASYRAIAEVLFGRTRVAGEHWKTSALKATTARLVGYGRRLIGDGYRALLTGLTSRDRNRKSTD